MKKIYAIAAVMVMLFSMNMVASAAKSPTATVVEQEATDKSPKTGDMNILLVELAGAACAVTAVVAARKSRVEA